MKYLVKPEDLVPPITERLEPDASLPRVCIIGAGSSGITAAKALFSARIPFDCFEMGTVLGGNWVFNNTNGVSACYRSLEINTSCRRMAFSDFPMPDYFPDYARHFEVRDYFERYVDHFGFRHTISFETKVEHVQRRPEDGIFEVEISGAAAAGGRETREYDAVMVCNGHHWDARWPDPPYQGSFDGEQMHSHQYREPEQLAGRHVVVVGQGNSGMDVAVEASYVAASTTLSVRRGQWVLPKFTAGKPTDQRVLPSWVPWPVRRKLLELTIRGKADPSLHGLPAPDHLPGQSHPVQCEQLFSRIEDGRITPRPAIDSLAGDRVVFADGTSAEADLIVWATGYRVSFPFFDPDFVSAPGNELPLWKRVIHPEIPGLFFVGLLQPLGAVMPVAEAQARWLADLLRGRYFPPSVNRMRRGMVAEHQEMERRFYRSARHTMEIDFDSYLAELERERRRGEQRARKRGYAPAIPARARREAPDTAVAAPTSA